MPSITIAVNKSDNCRYTLKVTEFCMINFHSSTILNNIELYKFIM